MIKKIMLISIFGAILMAQGVVITTGSPKGSYYEYGIKMGKKIKNSTVKPSNGSVQNFDRLVNGEAQVAIAQADAFRYYIRRHPEAENKIEPIGTLYKECVFLVTRKDGKIEDDGDLQEEGVKVDIGKNGSGSQVTWEYMTMLENGFSKADTYYNGGNMALAKVKSGVFDAAIIVTKPRIDSRVFKQIEDAGLTIRDITDWDLNDKFKGEPIYTFETVKVFDRFFGGKVNTICTTANVYVSKDVDDKIKDRIAEAVLSFDH